MATDKLISKLNELAEWDKKTHATESEFLSWGFGDGGACETMREAAALIAARGEGVELPLTATGAVLREAASKHKEITDSLKEVRDALKFYARLPNETGFYYRKRMYSDEGKTAANALAIFIRIIGE